MQHVIIAGGTGLVGTRLTELLIQRGYKVTILTRNKNKASNNAAVSYACWDIIHKTIDAEPFATATAIINLAGAGIAEKRWTPERKKELVNSRVNACNTIVNALQETPNQIQTIINASAVGWYHPNVVTTKKYQEEEPANTDFLGTTCKQWEQAIHPVTLLKKRLVKFRIGIVLSKDGGALKEFLKPIRYGIASILGNGKQQISWIHIDDVCNMFIHALENENITGVFNAVAPDPITNAKLTMALAKKKRGMFFIPVIVPKFILKLVLGEMSTEVLKSSNISCKKWLDFTTNQQKEKFSFKYPTIEAAINNLV